MCVADMRTGSAQFAWEVEVAVCSVGYHCWVFGWDGLNPENENAVCWESLLAGADFPNHSQEFYDTCCTSAISLCDFCQICFLAVSLASDSESWSYDDSQLLFTELMLSGMVLFIPVTLLMAAFCYSVCHFRSSLQCGEERPCTLTGFQSLSGFGF